MSLLRIYISLTDAAMHCQWALLNNGLAAIVGEGTLAELPKDAEHIQLLLPATQVLVTRAQLPPAARRSTSSVLAYAIEDEMMGDPDSNQVNWLGSVGDDVFDVLAVIDKSALLHWQHALAAVGIHNYDIHCEALMLPHIANTWSLAWNGHEGFVRCNEFEGSATDCGDSETAPLSLHLMLEEAKLHKAEPEAIVIYINSSTKNIDGKIINLDKWSKELAIPVRIAGNWDWRSAPVNAGIVLAQQKQHWRALANIAFRLRPAAWLCCAILALHAIALAIDWSSLANEQHTLHQQMETRFRATFPDAMAVTDPALQMRRKLAEAHNTSGQADSSHFLSMIEPIAIAIKDVPSGSVRTISYENGRITIELLASNQELLQRIVTNLVKSGLSVETHIENTNVVVTVRSS